MTVPFEMEGAQSFSCPGMMSRISCVCFIFSSWLNGMIKKFKQLYSAAYGTGVVQLAEQGKVIRCLKNRKVSVCRVVNLHGNQ